MMATTYRRVELECSICLNIYTDPVRLRCGHSFCQYCIDRVLDSQEESEGHSCPKCRGQFQQRSALKRNMTLYNMVETFWSAQLEQEESENDYTQGKHAVKSSLLGANLSKSQDCLLCDPTTSLGECGLHKKVLEYYCTEDAACICGHCILSREHRGHQVEMLDEATEKRKKKLRYVHQKVTAEREETKRRLRTLWERKQKAQEKSADVTENVVALFRDLRKCLEDLERRVLSEICRHKKDIADLIQKLKIKKEELSRKMRHIEELCNMTDPLTVLQDSDSWELCDTEDRHDKQLHDGGDLDVVSISHTLHTGLADIIKGINVCFYLQEPEEILLDVNTANNWLRISADRRTASRSHTSQKHPKSPERFGAFHFQVLSSQDFSSGQHFREVDVGKSENWKVGMCYASIARKGIFKPHMGSSKRGWCLEGHNSQYYAAHGWTKVLLCDHTAIERVRIFLNYEAGQISFYKLGKLIQHLHTFTATFTEPLRAALCVHSGSVAICGGTSM